MGHKITLLPGDGIGPEVTQAMQECVRTLGVKIDWDVHEVGDISIKKNGAPMPPAAVESIKKNKVAIKGPITTPVGTGFRSVNVMLRQDLDLYANVRPVKRYGSTNRAADNIDIVIFRENTEDLYAGVEFKEGEAKTKDFIKQINTLQPKQVKIDSGITIKAISISGTKRIMEAACKYAVQNNRKKITIVHKANIMKFSDGLFLEVARNVAKDYEGKVMVEDCIVDALCMKLVQKPESFDLLVLPNLYGDIVSDLCAGLVGGLGIAPGANIGEHAAVFEPVHGSAPDIAGQNKSNPTATLLSAVLMLRYIGETQAAQRLDTAVNEVIKEGKKVTADLITKDNKSKPASTTEMTEAICEKLKQF
jgi:isocitrate dehydrogenase (NAD+)